MPFADVVRNLGDAIAGVDRDKSFMEGQQARANYDQTQAQTDAAMELAKQRRIEAEVREQEKAAREAFAAAAAAEGFNPSQANIGDIVLGGMGSDFSGAMQGRNYGQQYDQRAAVATPEGAALGDQIVTDDVRQAAMDALAPAAAVATRRPRTPGTPIPVDDGEGGTILVHPDGTPMTVDTPEGPRPARPGARPATPRADPGPTNQQRNFTWLTQELGVDEEAALRISTNTEVDPAAVYQRARDAALRAYQSDEDAHAAGLAAVEAIGGLEQDLIPNDDAADDGDYAEGEELVNPETNQRIVLRNGIWVDMETGQPVQ